MGTRWALPNPTDCSVYIMEDWKASINRWMWLETTSSYQLLSPPVSHSQPICLNSPAGNSKSCHWVFFWCCHQKCSRTVVTRTSHHNPEDDSKAAASATCHWSRWLRWVPLCHWVPQCWIQVFSIWYLVFAIWYLIFGIRYLLFVIWYLIFGIWYLLFVIWYLVFAIWYLVFGIWIWIIIHSTEQQLLNSGCWYLVVAQFEYISRRFLNHMKKKTLQLFQGCCHRQLFQCNKRWSFLCETSFIKPLSLQ